MNTQFPYPVETKTSEPIPESTETNDLQSTGTQNAESFTELTGNYYQPFQSSTTQDENAPYSPMMDTQHSEPSFNNQPFQPSGTPEGNASYSPTIDTQYSEPSFNNQPFQPAAMPEGNAHYSPTTDTQYAEPSFNQQPFQPAATPEGNASYPPTTDTQYAEPLSSTYTSESSEVETQFSQPPEPHFSETLPESSGTVNQLFVEMQTAKPLLRATEMDTSFSKTVEPPIRELSPKLSEPEKKEEVNIEQLTPGARLRHIRKQKNLSVQHIADKLCLSPNTIEALENDNYSNLPPTVFTRGYLCNYARLLEVVPSPILASYDRLQRRSPIVPIPTITSPPVKQKQVNSKDWRITIITTVLVIAVLIFVALALSKYPNISFNQTKVPEEVGGGKTLAVPPTQPPLTSTTEGLPVFVMEPPSEDYTPPNGNLEGDEVDPTEEGVPIGAPTTTASDPKKLTVHFNKTTWVEVRDNTDKVLFNGSTTGDLPVEGNPPFRISVGHTQGVEVEYAGKREPLNNMPRQGTRRLTFSVGTASTTTTTQQ